MTVLTQRMREELARRNYAQTTIRTYPMAIDEFRRHADKRLDHLGPEDIRRYQVALLEDKNSPLNTWDREQHNSIADSSHVVCYDVFYRQHNESGSDSLQIRFCEKSDEPT